MLAQAPAGFIEIWWLSKWHGCVGGHGAGLSADDVDDLYSAGAGGGGISPAVARSLADAMVIHAIVINLGLGQDALTVVTASAFHGAVSTTSSSPTITFVGTLMFLASAEMSAIITR
ncbi:hypothetical protein [Rhizobium mesoamericanum]|uniref:hypothetical protein n=1 Tax=Rhizobium mesoamericanum TaxID=1079800 RepID=UPI0012DFD577|nr:hypothetical protein [Rhizobium mesoamericanum]